MPCDTIVRKNQSLEDRKKEVRKKSEKIAKAITDKRVKVTVGPQGAVAFSGISSEDRAGMTDACIYRRIMAGNSALAKAAIAQAELLSGRKVSLAVIGRGDHSHDGGKTWHYGKG